MKAILTVHNIASDFVTTVWTPIFVVIFLAIVAYALWPKKSGRFRRGGKDAAAGGVTRHELTMANSIASPAR